MKKTEDGIFMEQEEFENIGKLDPKEVQTPIASLYELNQMAFKNMDAWTGDGESKGELEFFNWISQYRDKKYFMLLCNELRYYTVFHMADFNAKRMWDELKDVMSYVGPVCLMEKDSNNCWSVWAKSEDEPHLFYMFPYDNGVVEV